MDAHQAAMAAIRKGQFKLRSPLQSKDHSQSSEARFTSMVQICVMFRPHIPSESAANAFCTQDSILVAWVQGGEIAGNATGNQEAVAGAPRNQQPALKARGALMSAIRTGVGCFLRYVETVFMLQAMEARTASQKQEVAADAPGIQRPAPDAREALMSAIRNRQFNLKSVCGAPEPRE